MQQDNIKNSLTKNYTIEIDKNKLLFVKFNEKSYKETSKLQNQTINDLSDFISRTFNQININ